MDKKKKGKRAGLLGTLVVHVAVVLLLILLGFDLPAPQQESGMPVMLGDVSQAGGLSDEPVLVPVDVVSQLPVQLPDLSVVDPASNPASDPASNPASNPASDPADEQDLLTQDEEETVAIKPHSKASDRDRPAQQDAQQDAHQDAQTAAQRAEQARLQAEAEAEQARLQAEAEAERARLQAEAEAEQARREAEEAARRRVAGAFGKGAQMGSQGTDSSQGTAGSGQGTAGSPAGNSPDGATQGEGGYGTFSLGGRSIGEGGLPRPVYDVQEEGKVVVDITVSPAGNVIATAINRQTNTVNQSLRRAAEDAAKKAKFNAVSGTTNQTGTITYYFKLR